MARSEWHRFAFHRPRLMFININVLRLRITDWKASFNIFQEKFVCMSTWSSLISSFCLFRGANSDLQIIKYSSQRRKLHRFEAGLYGAASKWIYNKSKFKVTWKILKQAAPYNPTSNPCNLCLWEKYLSKPDLASLNKWNELITSCRHANKFFLKNVKF